MAIGHAEGKPKATPSSRTSSLNQSHEWFVCALVGRIDYLLAALPLLDPLALDGVIAREVRDADF